MEDMIKALLEVVRAQHSATQGTDAAPLRMDDVVDMVFNLTERPEEPEEEAEVVETLQKMIADLAPDLFPPKAFEEQSDSEQAASITNMLEQSLQSGRHNNIEETSKPQQEPYTPSYSYEEEEEEEQQVDPGALNDLIYKNLMDMMGLQEPQLEYPFDRSQIVYGHEKTFTEQLEEEARESRKADEEQKRKLSAWELAQNAIDEDETAREKEPYIPQVVEEPQTKSASQLAAEAIAQSQKQDQEKLEIERQAELLMEQARQRGQDPMKFALHQQEILQYMEKNSDELVSFEDYEDLSPEEKYEIERQIQIEKEIEAGVSPDEVKGEVPIEFIPEELRAKYANAEVTAQDAPVQETSAPQAPAQPAFTEEMLRQLSQEVLRENAEMIEEEGGGEDIQAAIMENIMKMMSGSGVAVPQENVDDLLNQVANPAPEPQREEPVASIPVPEPVAEEVPRGISAAELAMAAQRAMQPEPKEVQETKSAVELAKEALARELEKQRSGEGEEELNLDDLNDDFDDFDDLDEEEIMEPSIIEETAKEEPEAKEETEDLFEDDFDDFDDDEDEVEEEASEESDNEEEIKEAVVEESEAEATVEEKVEEPEEEIEYVDPDVYVLGEHTQAEVDEALENLETLGLEGDVFERAKNMILLELAGSEIELERWKAEQEQSKKKKAAAPTLEDEELSDEIDGDELEMEFESALDDFEEEFEEEAPEEEKEEALEEVDEHEEEEKEEEIPVKEEKESVEEEKNEELAPEVVEVEEIPRSNRRTFAGARNTRTKRNVVHRREKKEKVEPQPVKVEEKVEEEASAKSYEVSIRNSFILKNSASYMDNFEKYISETQDRKLSTGFKRLDSMLRYGLHKGSYFIDASPMYLKNVFMQQIADKAAEDGVDVLYISTELSRYELMTDTLSRLSFKMNHYDPDKAVSVMSIMTGEDGANLSALKNEMNWYRSKISEHLFILDQEAVEDVIDSMEDATPGEILAEIIRSIVREGAHKPVVFIDNLENIAFAQTAKEMEPLMDGMKALAKELGIPIIMSYGYAQMESYDDIYVDHEFNEEIGNMCDVYMELSYAPMVTEDGEELTEDDIVEMSEDGESLLVDIQLHRNRRNVKAGCQVMVTPMFGYFGE